MAKKKVKAFELECPNTECRGKVFEITRKMEGKEKGTVVKEVIECPYCHQSAAYEIPYEYTEKKIIVRGIPE
jgi:aspartate carbamoyltransferase regulatory subunit